MLTNTKNRKWPYYTRNRENSYQKSHTWCSTDRKNLLCFFLAHFSHFLQQEGCSPLLLLLEERRRNSPAHASGQDLQQHEEVAEQPEWRQQDPNAHVGGRGPHVAEGRVDGERPAVVALEMR